jgi:hypothetical protein
MKRPRYKSHLIRLTMPGESLFDLTPEELFTFILLTEHYYAA